MFEEWFARNYRAVLQRTPERQVAAALKKKNPALLAPEKNPKNSKQEEQWFFLLRTTKRTARRMMFFCSSWGSFLGILRESKPEEPFCCSKQKHKLTTDKQQGSIQQETRFCFFVSGSFKNKKKHKLTTNNVVEQHQVPGSWLSGSSETNHGFWWNQSWLSSSSERTMVYGSRNELFLKQENKSLLLLVVRCYISC